MNPLLLRANAIVKIDYRDKPPEYVLKPNNPMYTRELIRVVRGSCSSIIVGGLDIIKGNKNEKVWKYEEWYRYKRSLEWRWQTIWQLKC